MVLRLQKRNKRLEIVTVTDERVYSPPDYLRSYIRGRNEVQEVVDKLNSGCHYVDTIVEFESMIWNRSMKRVYDERLMGNISTNSV
jgi:hypothetical protein